MLDAVVQVCQPTGNNLHAGFKCVCALGFETPAAESGTCKATLTSFLGCCHFHPQAL